MRHTHAHRRPPDTHDIDYRREEVYSEALAISTSLMKFTHGESRSAVTERMMNHVYIYILREIAGSASREYSRLGEHALRILRLCVYRRAMFHLRSKYDVD